MLKKFLPGALGAMLFSGLSLAANTRQLVALPDPARDTLRQEMLDKLMAVNEVLALLAEGKVKEAGQSATWLTHAPGNARDRPRRSPSGDRICRGSGNGRSRQGAGEIA